MPRYRRCAGADAARDHGTHSNRQTDQRRGLEESDYASESNCRGDGLLTKQRDVKDVKKSYTIGAYNWLLVRSQAGAG